MGYRASTSNKNKKLETLQRDLKTLKIRNKVLEKVVADTTNEYHQKFLTMEANMAYTKGSCAGAVARIDEIEKEQKHIKTSVQNARERSNVRYFYVLGKLKKKVDEPAIKVYVFTGISAFVGCSLAYFIFI